MDSFVSCIERIPTGYDPYASTYAPVPSLSFHNPMVMKSTQVSTIVKQSIYVEDTELAVTPKTTQYICVRNKEAVDLRMKQAAKDLISGETPLRQVRVAEAGKIRTLNY